MAGFLFTGGGAATFNVLNVKNYGAVGNGIADDTTAINSALTALWSSGGTLFFPTGTYLVTASIDFSAGAGQNRICGTGIGATHIIGTINDGFIFTSPNGTNSGVQEISDLTVTNSSTIIGTGAVRWLSGTTGSIFRNVTFNGQIGFDAAFNSFNVTLLNCQMGPTTPATPGTCGIISNGVNLIGVRPSTAWDVFFIGNGTNGHFLGGNSIESCANALLLGIYQGWASACSTNGTTLTVGGTISPAITGGSTQTSFAVGDYVFGAGVTTDAHGFVWGNPLSGPRIASLGTGTGGAGTYILDTNCGTISATPMFTRRGAVLSCFTMAGFEAEGCKRAIYISNLQESSIRDCQLTGVVGEAILENGGGAKGDTAIDHLYVGTMSSCVLEGIRGGNGTSRSALYFDPAGTFINCAVNACSALATDNGVSDSAATISGTTMHINSVVSGAFGIGMAVTGTGVSANTTITAITDATHFTVTPSQTVSATTLTAVGGTAWTVPTASSSAAGIAFNNCDSPALILTFTKLPGQAGADTNLTLKEGLEYDISDSNTATWGATAAGGSSNHVMVRYNGTNWTVMGK